MTTSLHSLAMVSTLAVIASLIPATSRADSSSSDPNTPPFFPEYGKAPYNYDWSTNGEYFARSVAYDTVAYIPTTGAWSDNGNNQYRLIWGWHETLPVMGDYDGDGIADCAVFYPVDGRWYIRYSNPSETPYDIVEWGWNGVVPVPADYDGDGTTDIAVYNPSDGTWYIRYSNNGEPVAADPIQWGFNQAMPVVGDYDGDGLDDIAVFYQGVWYIRFWTEEYEIDNFGWNGVVPLPADLDLDGTTDIIVYDRGSSTWYMYLSGSGFYTTTFGYASAKPMTYDGFFGVYDPVKGVWYEQPCYSFMTSAYSMAKSGMPAVPMATVLKQFGMW